MKMTDVKQGQTWYVPMMDFGARKDIYYVGKFFIAPSSWPAVPKGIISWYHHKTRVSDHLRKCKIAGIEPTIFRTRRQAERWIKLRGYAM